jgi:hypothetical protein
MSCGMPLDYIEAKDKIAKGNVSQWVTEELVLISFA